MPKRDLDDFAKRHNLTQESLLELGEILKGKPTSLPTSEVYTIVEDLNLPPTSPLPLELPPDPNSSSLPGRVVAARWVDPGALGRRRRAGPPEGQRQGTLKGKYPTW